MKNYDFIKVKTRPFPSVAEVNHPYIFGGVEAVINVSEKEDSDVISQYRTLGISYHHYPTQEESIDMNWENIKAATKVLADNIRKGIPTVVHCIGGNNRSPMIVECAHFAVYGEHLQDEYKGCQNHLFYNLKFLNRPLSEVEAELRDLG